jgi:hypothetical protein
VEADRAIAYLLQALDDVVSIVHRLGTLLAPAHQEQAFGAPGVAGIPDRIRHLATRWTAVYADLLAWSARLRGASKPAKYGQAFELLARLADSLLQEYRDFTDRFLQEIDRLPHRIAAKEKVSLEFNLVLSVDTQLLEQCTREIKRLAV